MVTKVIQEKDYSILDIELQYVVVAMPICSSGRESETKMQVVHTALSGLVVIRRLLFL